MTPPLFVSATEAEASRRHASRTRRSSRVSPLPLAELFVLGRRKGVGGWRFRLSETLRQAHAYAQKVESPDGRLRTSIKLKSHEINRVGHFVIFSCHSLKIDLVPILFPPLVKHLIQLPSRIYKTCRADYFCFRFEHIIDYGAVKPTHLGGCWVKTRGEPGPISETVSATVPG